MSDTAITFRIVPDDYHATDVGQDANGHQFFLTTPFEPAGPDRKGAEYVALYLFDTDGCLIEARIDNLGPRETLDRDKRSKLIEQHLESLGDYELRDIWIRPFSVDHDGLQFGLILRPKDDEDDPDVIEVQPGNYMAFFEPWDSGEYDT